MSLRAEKHPQNMQSPNIYWKLKPKYMIVIAFVPKCTLCLRYPEAAIVALCAFCFAPSGFLFFVLCQLCTMWTCALCTLQRTFGPLDFVLLKAHWFVACAVACDSPALHCFFCLPLALLLIVDIFALYLWIVFIYVLVHVSLLQQRQTHKHKKTKPCAVCWIQ